MDLQQEIIRLRKDGFLYREIAQELSMPKSSVEYRLNRFLGEERWRVLNNSQEQLILGSLLGDAHLHVKKPRIERNETKTQYDVVFTQGEKQLEYLLWKHKILNSACKVRKIAPSKDGFSKLPWYKFSFSHAPFLRRIVPLVLLNGKKKVSIEWLNSLDEISLAFWFQDDGHSIMGGRRDKDGKHVQQVVRLATNSFSDEEMEIIAEYFRTKWEIKCCILHSKGPVLIMNNSNAIRFITLISPWVFLNYKIKITGVDYSLIGTKLHLLHPGS